MPTTINFLGCVDGEPAATVRLLLPNADVAARCKVKLGLSIELSFDLQHMKPGIALAEIPRSAVLKPYRRTGVMRHVYFAAYEESIKRGITHWIAAASMDTDCEADASAARELLKARGLFLSEYNATCRKNGQAPATPRFTLFSEIQRRQIKEGNVAGVELPYALGLFAGKLSARYFGSPYFDSDFRIFAIPLIIQLSDLATAPYGRRPQTPV